MQHVIRGFSKVAICVAGAAPRGTCVYRVVQRVRCAVHGHGLKGMCEGGGEVCGFVSC